MAGDGSSSVNAADQPILFAEMYDPYAPEGNRTTKLANTEIARMYGSTAALTTDGTILVAGCDRCRALNVSASGLRSCLPQQ